MRLVTCTLIVVAGLGGQSGGETVAPQDWERADAAIVRLKPSAFPGLPAGVRQELDRRACTVPQSFANKRPHNVIRGRFTSSAQRDLAVLCSRDRVSTILVFRGGSPASVAELASRPDRGFLQVVEAGGVIGYSRALGVADPKYIRNRNEAHGGPRLPQLDHDGINDIFMEKASVVWYRYGGRWLELTGAN